MARAGLHARGLGKLFEKLAFATAELLRHRDLEVDVEVPASALAVDLGEPLPGEALDITVLGPCCDADALLIFEGRDDDIPAEGGLSEGDGEREVEIGAIALEHLGGLDLEEDVEVAVRSTVATGVAFASVADAVSRLYAGRDLDGDVADLSGLSLATALGAELVDALALSLAPWAGGLDSEQALGHADASGAAAGVAGRDGGAGFSAVSFTPAAGGGSRDFDDLLAAVDRVLERDPESHLEVGASRGCVGVARAPSAESEEIREDVSEIREDVVHVGARAGAADALVPELVVHATLLVVAEDGVRLRTLLELLFGDGVPRVSVGVVGHREAAIRLLDVAGRCVPLDTEHVVVVSFVRHRGDGVRKGRGDRAPGAAVATHVGDRVKREGRDETFGIHAPIQGIVRGSARILKADRFSPYCRARRSAEDNMANTSSDGFGQMEREARAAQSREAAYVADPVQRYLAEIRRHEVLTRDEESSLASYYVETGDEQAELRLVNSNLRLVVKIALEYQSSRLLLLDLIQEGNVGLIHAVRKFDPDKKIRLASYAQWWIRAYILKYLMDNYKLVKVGTTQAQRKLFYNLKREKERLSRQGLVATPSLLARSLAVRERDVIEMSTRLAGRESSLDAPLQDGERGTLSDMLAADVASIDDALAVRQESDAMRLHLDGFAATLQGRDVDIWHRRMVAEKPQTLQEIGDLFGVSRERARQLEARIMRRLSKYLGERVKQPGAVDQLVVG